MIMLVLLIGVAAAAAATPLQPASGLAGAHDNQTSCFFFRPRPACEQLVGLVTPDLERPSRELLIADGWVDLTMNLDGQMVCSKHCYSIRKQQHEPVCRVLTACARMTSESQINQQIFTLHFTIWTANRTIATFNTDTYWMNPAYPYEQLPIPETIDPAMEEHSKTLESISDYFTFNSAIYLILLIWTGIVLIRVEHDVYWIPMTMIVLVGVVLPAEGMVIWPTRLTFTLQVIQVAAAIVIGFLFGLAPAEGPTDTFGCCCRREVCANQGECRYQLVKPRRCSDRRLCSLFLLFICVLAVAL